MRGGGGTGFPPSPMMAQALLLARQAAEAGEVPVGAILTAADGTVLAQAHNQTRTLPDPTAHAEILVLREAALRSGNERLNGCTLWVTLEPCPMCAAAISFSRIRRLYFGAGDPKGGAVENGVRLYESPTCHHAPEVYGGLRETDAAALLRDFFRERR